MTEPGATDERARHLENLRAVYESLTQPPPAPPAATDRPPSGGSGRRRAGRSYIVGAALAGLAFLAGKLKLFGLLAGALKLKTLGTMVLSVAAYATQWGLPFALGFVLLIFFHELGHAFVLRREGIPAGAPVFIPFVGAFITMRGWPRDAYVEAKVAIGGPVVGSLVAWMVLVAGLALRYPLLVALGHAGILLNLFNLIPVSPLDGGRIAGAFTRTFWLAGYGAGLVALVVTRSPLLFLVLLVGLVTLWQRWRHPVPGYDAIPRARRLAVGLGYAGLVMALAATLPLGQDLTARAP